MHLFFFTSLPPGIQILSYVHFKIKSHLGSITLQVPLINPQCMTAVCNKEQN